jgi:hypothetical protein
MSGSRATAFRLSRVAVTMAAAARAMLRFYLTREPTRLYR